MACDRKIGPYDCCTVVQGDCLELMKAIPDGAVDAVLLTRSRGALFHVSFCGGAPHFSERLPQGTWLIWDKRYPNGFAWLADGEAAWMNKGRGLYICSITNQGHVRPDLSQHPTQKPVALMMWCIDKAGMAETIFDPFLGSGTTAVAAKKLGRHFLGFEISQEYCRIARERIALVEAQPSLFDPNPEQLELARE